MAYFEQIMESGGQAARRSARAAVVLAAIIFGLHFVQVRIDKISIGGSDIIITDAQALRGVLGVVLVYLLLTAARSATSVFYAAKAVDPDIMQKLEAVRKGMAYQLHSVMSALVALVEITLVSTAIWLTWPDTMALLASVLKKVSI